MNPIPMQVSVSLPFGLMEGLLANYSSVKNGEKGSFAALAIYAMSELDFDLRHPEEMQAAGIVLPQPDTSYTISIPKEKRNAEHGFYSMRIPPTQKEVWERLLEKHDYNGPSVVYRALLHQYRCVRSYYQDSEPKSDFLTKYPRL